MAEASCPRSVRPRRGFEPSKAFYTTVTSFRGDSGLSISREPFDFCRAQRREGILAAQRPKTVVSGEGRDQSSATHNGLWMGRNVARLLTALLPPEAQYLREGERLGGGRKPRNLGAQPRCAFRTEASAGHRREGETTPSRLPERKARAEAERRTRPRGHRPRPTRPSETDRPIGTAPDRRRDGGRRRQHARGRSGRRLSRKADVRAQSDLWRGIRVGWRRGWRHLHRWHADRHQGEQEPRTGTRHLQPAFRLLLPVLHRRRRRLSEKNHFRCGVLRSL